MADVDQDGEGQWTPGGIHCPHTRQTCFGVDLDLQAMGEIHPGGAGTKHAGGETKVTFGEDHGD